MNKEEVLIEKLKKENKRLKNKLKEKDNEIYYLICCRLGDEPSDRGIKEKYDKIYNF